MKNISKISIYIFLISLIILGGCSKTDKEKLTGVWVYTNPAIITGTALDFIEPTIIKRRALILDTFSEDVFNNVEIKEGKDILKINLDASYSSKLEGAIKFINDSVFMFNDSMKYIKCPDYLKTLSGTFNVFVNGDPKKYNYSFYPPNTGTLINKENSETNDFIYNIKYNFLIINNLFHRNQNCLIVDAAHLMLWVDRDLVELVKEGNKPLGLKNPFVKENNNNNNNSSNYKYPEGSSRNLTSNELSGMSKFDLKIMRNEIFARHGYIFKTDDMRTYFNNQAWYVPKFDDVTSMLSSIEKSNIDLIKSFEK